MTDLCSTNPVKLDLLRLIQHQVPVSCWVDWFIRHLHSWVDWFVRHILLSWLIHCTPIVELTNLSNTYTVNWLTYQTTIMLSWLIYLTPILLSWLIIPHLPSLTDWFIPHLPCWADWFIWHLPCWADWSSLSDSLCVASPAPVHWLGSLEFDDFHFAPFPSSTNIPDPFQASLFLASTPLAPMN